MTLLCCCCCHEVTQWRTHFYCVMCTCCAFLEQKIANETRWCCAILLLLRYTRIDHETSVQQSKWEEEVILLVLFSSFWAVVAVVGLCLSRASSDELCQWFVNFKSFVFFPPFFVQWLNVFFSQFMAIAAPFSHFTFFFVLVYCKTTTAATIKKKEQQQLSSNTSRRRSKDFA